MKPNKNQANQKLRDIAVATLAAFVLTAQAAQADSDGDGVDDPVDNCVQVANPLQRDTDLDGYGNRCDADFNNDQIVNVIDLGELKQAFFSTADEQDLNGDGLVNAIDLGILKTYMFGAPGPGAPDTDGDGVPLAQDRCPDSPTTQDMLEDGCTAFDVIMDPIRFVDLTPQTTPILASFASMPELSFFEGGVVAGITAIDQGIAAIKRGDVCEGTTTFWNGYSQIDGASLNLAGFIGEYEYSLSHPAPFTHGDCGPGGPPECAFGADHTETDLLVAQYQDLHSDLGLLLQTAEDRGGLLSNACDASTTTMFITGRVVEIDDASRQIRINGSGTGGEVTIGLTDDVQILSDVYLGREIRAIGFSYGPDAGIANVLVPLTPEPPQATLIYNTCASLRIAPFQRFTPVSNGPYELHDPEAYRYDTGKLRLEKGMAFASTLSFLGCVDSDDVHTVYYSQDLRLEFLNKNTGAMETRTLAFGLNSNSLPVALPYEVEHGSDATLTVSFKRQSCPIPTGQSWQQTCSVQEVYRTDVYVLSVWDRETFCNVIYDETEFALEYTGPTEFRSTHVSDYQSLLAVPDAGTQMSVVAEGYSVNGNTSSYPSISQIGEGQPFALYSHDCVTQEGQLYVTGSCGTNEASGLRWPRLTGVRNGKNFSYSCSLPQVVRDLRDYCPQAPNALYKFPFSGSSPTWTMSQANNGDFTHNGNQAFAFDFVASGGTTIRAARRGTVAFVRENQTGNSYYDEDCSNCMANRVTLRHEDGSLTDYLHLQTNGALVSLGQYVQRGTAIGLVGNTGFSTGDHLHFQARRSGLPTHPVRFEALDNGLGTAPSTCWIPNTGDPLASDN